jgi:ubiquinone biosynthesis protein COQ9
MTAKAAKDLSAVRIEIASKAYELAATRGWTRAMIDDAAIAAGHNAGTVKAVFPAGVRDVLAAFSNHIDAQMLQKLAGKKTEDQAGCRHPLAAFRAL